MDVKSAFLNGYIVDEVYLEHSLGFKNLDFLTILDKALHFPAGSDFRCGP